jgi:orotidine-5'-phosphate decarboxylase
MDTAALSEIGINLESESLVRVLAGRAADCGLDGVVASARETSMIREAVSRKDFLIVTPGIRPTLESGDDQRRTMTAADAVRAGADYIVVGRPILEDENPAGAAEGIISEIAAALS